MAKAKEYGTRFGDGSEIILSDIQLQGIDLLISGSSKSEVAAILDIDRVTIWRWFREPQFQAQYNQRCHDIYDANTDKLRALGDQAIDVLVEMLSSKKENIRLRAAGIVLKSCNLEQLGKPGGLTDVEDIERQKRINDRFNDIF